MLVVTGFALAASVALGTSVRLGLVLGRWRWLHHALFFATVVAACVTLLIDVLRGSWRAVPTGVLVVVLALLPRTRGGSRPHVQVAVLATAAWVASVAVTVSG